MKILKYIQILFIAAILLGVSCKPDYKELSTSATPDAAQVSFTVTPVAGDAYKVKVTNTSAIVGIAAWDFGNGTKGAGETATTEFNVKGEYTITLSLVCKGGIVTATKKYTQATGNIALLLNDKVKLMIGTVNDAAGKTWMIDRDMKGHFGVGDPNGVNNPANPKIWTKIEDVVGLFGWWTAGPDDKKDWQSYDDELTFIFADGKFKCIYKTNDGTSGRKEAVTAHASFYSNVGRLEDAYDRTFTYEAARNGLNGGWIYSEEAGVPFVTFTGESPIYPMYDINCTKYRLSFVDADHLVLIGNDDDNGNGSARLHILKRKGYVNPSPTPLFDVVSAKADKGLNNFTFALSNVLFPNGATIAKVSMNYGDGSDVETSTDYTTTFSHVFLKVQPYTVTFTVTAGSGKVQTKTVTVTPTVDLSTYVPPVGGAVTVMYNDCGDTKVNVWDADGGFTFDNAAANPSVKSPNLSSTCYKYTKVDNQWANAFMKLPTQRFDLRTNHTFKFMVYGTAGNDVLLKLENTDLGGNAWQTGTADLKYKIKVSNTWEEVSFDFAGVGNNGSADPKTGDITTDERTNQGYYNVVRIMLNPGNGTGTFSCYLDNLQGPPVPGLKKK